MADRQFDLGEIKAHLEGPRTSPLFLLDACRWLVDEVERLRTVGSRLDAAKAYAKQYAQSYGAEHFEENFDPELLPWMGARIRKGLMKLGVETYGKLAALTSSEVLATKFLGQTSLVRMRNVLATRGLCFRDESAMTDRLTRIGEMAHGTGRHDDE